jgi:hypothetical protein
MNAVDPDLFGPRVATRHLPTEAKYLRELRPDVVGARKNETPALYARIYFLRRVGVTCFRAGGKMHLVGGKLMSHRALERKALQLDHSGEGIKFARRILGFGK